MIYLSISSSLTINFEALPGKNLVFIYVPSCLAHGLSRISAFLFLCDGPGAYITWKITISWKTRIPHFIVEGSRKSLYLEKNSEE